MTKTLTIGLLLGLAVAAAVHAQTGMKGYLTAAPDTMGALPPPPAAGSAAAAIDHDIYVRTRALEGSPRWALAKADAEKAPAAILADFDCAVGLKLDPVDEPTLFKLADRMVADASAIIKGGKDRYKRPRPFVSDPRPICTPDDKEVLLTTSYPSGHSTRAWAYGLILSEIAPAQASRIMARARAYGESRVICGVHYESDVEAGRSNAGILVAALHSEPAFAADLGQAKSEVGAALQANKRVPDAARCSAEKAALAVSTD